MLRKQTAFNFSLLMVLVLSVGCSSGLETDSGNCADCGSVDPFQSAAILELRIQAPTSNATTPLRNETNPVNSCSPLAASSAALQSIADCVEIGGVCSTGQYTNHIIFWELQDPDNGNTVLIDSRSWELATTPVAANAQCIDGYFKLRVFLPSTATKKRYLLQATIYGVDENGQLQSPSVNPSNVDSKLLDFSE